MSVFQFRGPLLPDSPLYKGRQADLNLLLRWCQSEVQHYGIVFGARQSGKSSLLLRLEKELSATYVVCHADFEYLSDATPARVFGALAQDFARAFSRTIPAAEIPDALRFSDYLSQLLEAHPKERVVLLIEELGALPKASRFALANALRALFNDRQRPARRMLARLMVIVAGNTELYDLAYTDVSPFANICETHYLVDLEESDAIALIHEGLSLLNVPLGQAAQLGASIYRLVHGYPYLTQRLGHALEIAQGSRGILTDDMLEDAATELITCGDPIIGHLQKVMLEQDLFPAARSILNEKLRFNRHEESLARLELAGFIRPENGFWQVRNPLYARAVQSWLDTAIKTEQPALHLGLVRIFGNKGVPVGAGFLVDHRRIITCAHVVAAALGVHDATGASGEVTLDFPLINKGTALTARILPLGTYESAKVDDIAIVELASDVPAQATPLIFSKMPPKWGGKFRACGFPARSPDGAWTNGVFRGPINDGRVELEGTQLTGYAIQPGFSGSPVWDESTGGVIGMIVAADTDTNIKAAFMVPVNNLEKVLRIR